MSWRDWQFDTVEMHTGGEPVRIISQLAGYIHGDDILAKRRDMRERFDAVRRLLMFEPRGHHDMYGAVLVQPSLPGADLAVLFIHNEGYSTMCGHAVIALARYAVDEGLVARQLPLTRVGIECPCGLVTAWVSADGAVSFDSVPSFAFVLDHPVSLPGIGELSVDIAYGGAFYVICPAARLGLSLDQPLHELVSVASQLTAAVCASLTLQHPQSADLAFLYGSILTDGQDEGAPSRNLCVFADAEVDRSPTGSGVSARMALRQARGQLAAGTVCEFHSPTGAIFRGEIVAQQPAVMPNAVTVRVSGRAHYSGRASWWLEADDVIGQGFLLR